MDTSQGDGREPAGRGLRRWLLRLAIAGASVMVALCITELISRVAVPQWQPSSTDRAIFWRHDPLLGWSHRPDQSGRFVGPEWDVHVHHNSHGLRDVEHDYEKPAGKRRLLLLGDSFGWGFGVQEDEMISAHLARDCPGWEVINGSVSGYSTDQELLWYRSKGVRYSPDVVVLLIFTNDIGGNWYAYYHDHQKPRFIIRDGTLHLENVPVPPPTTYEHIRNWLLSHTYLGNGYRQVKESLLERYAPPKPKKKRRVGGSAEEVTRSILLEFSAELRAASVGFLWVLIPMDDKRAAWFRQVATEANVPLLDLREAFDRAGVDGRSLVLGRNQHWNAEGHRVAAAAVEAFLAAQTWGTDQHPCTTPVKKGKRG